MDNRWLGYKTRVTTGQNIGQKEIAGDGKQSQGAKGKKVDAPYKGNRTKVDRKHRKTRSKESTNAMVQSVSQRNQ